METYVDAFVETIKSGGHIVHFSRRLNITIAEASRYVANLVKQEPDLLKYVERWPKNVTSGYVFIGDKHLAYGQDTRKFPIALLKPGDYVLGELWNKKRGFYELFRADPVIETKYRFLYEYKKQLRFVKRNDEILEKWFCDSDLEGGAANRVGKEYGCTQMYRTDDTRLGYRKGHWLGNVSSIAVIPVNYNWK